MVEGTTLAECCIVEDQVDKQMIVIKQLMEIEVTPEQKQIREQILFENYSNEKNFNRIIGLFS